MKVLVTDPVAEDGVAVLRQQAEVDVRIGLKPEELVALIGAYQGLVVRSETKVTADIIEAGKELQVIGRAGVGVDNIDVEAATQRGIVVVNAPTGNIVTTAEHTIALMFACARNVPQAYTSLKSGEWKRSKFVGTELRGKTLGIIGLGKVGSEVAHRALGLDMRLVVHDPYVSPDQIKNAGAESVSLQELLQRSDFVSVHVPLTESTKGLIGKKEFALMKSSARLINCARGGIVDEEALLEAVEAGQIAGAAVDVFAKEPATDNILLKSDKIVVTPHLGASTEEAQVNVARDVAEQVLEVLRGQPARYAVNMPLVPPEALSELTPYFGVAISLGELGMQLVEGQIRSAKITYSGDIALYDTTLLTASFLKGFLSSTSEIPINLINAYPMAKSRGFQIIEQKGLPSESYSNLIAVQVATNQGDFEIAGTMLRGQPHIVMIEGYWVDVVPSNSYWLLSHNLDRPGTIGRVGTILGQADINISCMQVGRLQPRGEVLMVLGLDEPIPDKTLKEVLSIEHIHSAKQVKL